MAIALTDAEFYALDMRDDFEQVLRYYTIESSFERLCYYYCEECRSADRPGKVSTLAQLDHYDATKNFSEMLAAKFLKSGFKTSAKYKYNADYVRLAIRRYWKKYSSVKRPETSPQCDMWDVIQEVKKDLQTVKTALLDVDHSKLVRGYVPFGSFTERYKYLGYFGLLVFLDNKKDMIKCFETVFRLHHYDDGQDAFMNALLWLDYKDKDIYNMVKEAMLYWHKEENYVMYSTGTGMHRQVLEVLELMTEHEVAWWNDKELYPVLVSAFTEETLAKSK
mmetsp:Transcript_2397/g.2681  ORF Transcript_2397/g.2681 Transcript_2397/m.2681 type:complete len:278 (+) Transcript_2397:47-880(+)